MPQVFDRETGQPVTVSPADAQAGLLSGKFALDADGPAVALRGKDGRVFTSAPDKVPGALATGAYSLLSPEEELKHRVAKEEAAKGIGGSIAEGIGSGANQLLLGIPEALTEATESPQAKAEREAREEYHHSARMLGGAVGVAGSLLAGGELFRAADFAGQAAERAVVPASEIAEASLARKLTATAANYATQGALFASPQALIQGAVGGDWKKAAETMAWGIGAGALLGGGAGALREGAGALLEGAQGLLSKDSVRDALNKFANERTLKAVGAERSQLNKLSEDRMNELADFIHENGLIKPGQSRQDLGDAIEAAHDKFGGQIGDTIERLDTLMQKGTATEDLTAHALKPGELGDAIKNALDSPELRMPMNADQARALDTIVESAHKMQSTWVNGREVIPFEAAQDFVSSLRRRYSPAVEKAMNEGGAKGPMAVTPLDEMKTAAYQVARDALHGAADRVAVAANEPALVGSLAAAKKSYATLAQLEKFSATLDRQQAGNRMVSLTDFLHIGQGGPIGAALQSAGAAIGGALGGGPGALIGQQAARVPGMALDFLAKHWMEDKGLVTLSAIAKRAAKEGPEVFSAVLASEGQKRLEASMGTVRDTIRNLAIRGVEEPSTPGHDHMRHLLGDTSGLSHEQQAAKLEQRITELASNPAALASATAQLSAPFSAASPELGAAYQAQLMHTLSYLYESLPKAAAPPLPFAPNDFAATPAQRLALRDKLEIVGNPMSAMRHMARGTLSDAHVEALQRVWPSVYGLMQQEILRFAGDNPDVKLPLADRQMIAKFLQSPVDGLSQHILALQASYARPAPQSNAASTSRPRRARMSKLPSMGSAFSATQGPQWGAQ